MVTTPQIEEFQAALDQARQSLEAQREELGKERQRLSVQDPEFLERGQKDMDRPVVEQQEELILDRLRAVYDALARIGAGAYGRCTECGQDIDPARLRAMPWTPLCRDCATRLQAAAEAAAPSEALPDLASMEGRILEGEAPREDIQDFLGEEAGTPPGQRLGTGNKSR